MYRSKDLPRDASLGLVVHLDRPVNLASEAEEMRDQVSQRESRGHFQGRPLHRQRQCPAFPADDRHRCRRRFRDVVPGTVFPLQEKYILCRCGHSNNKPFCDGTHKKIGFDGTETASRAPIAPMQGFSTVPRCS